jgi:hypothetical protein
LLQVLPPFFLTFPIGFTAVLVALTNSFPVIFVGFPDGLTTVLLTLFPIVCLSHWNGENHGKYRT